jgi:hypothetical protein
MATSETNRDITPFSAGTPTFHDPRGNDHKSIADHFFLGNMREGMRSCQPSDRLTICIGETVKLVLFVVDFLLNPLNAVHRASVPRDLCGQRLIANLYEGFVNFVTEAVVAADVEQLLVGVIRGRAVVVVRGGVDITLIYNSPFIHAAPRRGVHSHAHLDPLGCGDSLPVSSGDAERDVVLPAVADEAVGSGG